MMNQTQPYIKPRPPYPARRAAQTTRGRMNPTTLSLLIGVGVAVVLITLVLLAGLGALVVLSPQRVMSGVSVSGLPLGDLSYQAAQEQIDTLVNRPIRVTDRDRSWDIPLSDLGVTFDSAATLQAVKDAHSGAAVDPVYTVDLNAAQMGLVTLSETVNVAPVASPPQNGRSMDIPVMLDRLRVDVSGELADGVFELDMIETIPPEEVTGATYTGEKTTHVVERGQELGLIARQYGVSVEDIMALNDISNPDVIWVGQELIIPAGGEYIPENIPAAPLASGKSIVVSTNDQRIYAYENGQLVRSHLVSTGLPATPTVLGDYNIYVKYVADDMAGPDYFLPQVPYTMYFFQGYGIHGTYWHNAFGRPMSHGCVNLPVAEAEWFFNWAQVGTLVRVV
ncbi:MAG: L,D-transpeptidase family protein [Anaerolinea sp.]|nr:L,D-transpeptidase family protein [Anaerolinea sp.]